MRSTTEAEVSELLFGAMGSDCHVVVVDGDPWAVERARRRIDELEQRWSRFLADSDITRINLAGGRPVSVATSTLTLIEAMVAGWIATEGAFDPTMLLPLVELGYGASRDEPTIVTLLPFDALDRGDPSAIVIDRQGGTVLAPVGTCLDPGGIGKGLAADMVARQLVESGADGALVSIGGDIAVLGTPPRPEGWLIAVGDGTVCLSHGGVATSGTTRHAWTNPHDRSRRVHHLLDPATRGSTRGVVEASVIAGDARWAEVWTKALSVHGAALLPRLDEIGLGGRVVRADGSLASNESWDAFALPEARNAA